MHQAIDLLHRVDVHQKPQTLGLRRRTRPTLLPEVPQVDYFASEVVDSV